MQNHVSFLHEEFLKLPSFPRKALEAEFSLYTAKGGEVITMSLHGDLCKLRSLHVTVLIEFE